MDNAHASEQIREAIGSHGKWKLRLRTAVQLNRMDMPVEELSNCNCCAFGKWLGQARHSMAGDPHIAGVAALHSQFHAEAGRIARMIRDGQTADASAALADGKPFIETSEKLAHALIEWRRDIR